MTDIFKFWSQIGRGQKIHPADKSIFARIDPERHGFRTDCLPACYAGRLRSAPVVLLYLSPGFDKDGQDLRDARSKKGKDYYWRRWRGDEPLPGPEDAGYDWLRSRTKHFADYSIVREKVALLNIGAYHSENVKSYASLLALPSSRTTLSWAQNVLFPEAEAGKRIVICMRSAAYWGLETGRTYGKNLFTPQITLQGGYLRKNEENRRLIDMVRARLQKA